MAIVLESRLSNHYELLVRGMDFNNRFLYWKPEEKIRQIRSHCERAVYSLIFSGTDENPDIEHSVSYIESVSELYRSKSLKWLRIYVRTGPTR